MTDNERISKWLESICDPFEWRMTFKLGKIDFLKLTAWTPALYQKIKDAGLMGKFIAELLADLKPSERADPVGLMFAITSRTPTQKASALSRAIQEVS